MGRLGSGRPSGSTSGPAPRSKPPQVLPDGLPDFGFVSRPGTSFHADQTTGGPTRDGQSVVANLAGTTPGRRGGRGLVPSPSTRSQAGRPGRRIGAQGDRLL